MLLELGCQNTSKRYWWDFTSGQLAQDGRPALARPSVAADSASRREALVAALAASTPRTSPERATASNGHQNLGSTAVAERQPSRAVTMSERAQPELQPVSLSVPDPTVASARAAMAVPKSSASSAGMSSPPLPPPRPTAPSPLADGATTDAPAAAEPAPDGSNNDGLSSILPPASGALKDAFVRQLQLDRLTLRQMRSLLGAEEARRAVEVAAGATEATYERLALILFGTDLPRLLGKPAVETAAPTLSAEERLELQREKARVRARLRRAAIKAAKQA
ncbi:MAG: hypothetical protein M3336_08870 [Chloroflexota bacterium]|nr:hypothetical protein [Chloroflexota bacterium]